MAGKYLTLIAVIAAGLGGSAWAHGGGLNAEGCHNDRKNGGYHCHRSQAAPERPSRQERPSEQKREFEPQRFSSGAAAFANCSAARAAGAAPVRRGQPGYGTHLDRDGDGVGCE